MFWLAVFRHGTRAEDANYSDWVDTWVPYSRNVMSWSGGCLLTRTVGGYGVSPIVDIFEGSRGCLLIVRGSRLWLRRLRACEG